MGAEAFLAASILIGVALGIAQLIGPFVVGYRIRDDRLTMSFAMIPLGSIVPADIASVAVIPWWRVFSFFLAWKLRNRPFAESIVLHLHGNRIPVIISPRSPEEFARRLTAMAAQAKRDRAALAEGKASGPARPFDRSAFVGRMKS